MNTCFKKRADGLWDSDCYSECISDSSSTCEHGDCPLEFEGTCDNCRFKEGFKKCGNCRQHPRSTHFQDTGYYWMCDACIEIYRAEESVS